VPKEKGEVILCRECPEPRLKEKGEFQKEPGRHPLPHVSSNMKNKKLR